MAETSIGLPSEGVAVALAKDTTSDASTIAKSSSYCGECGSWGAHVARCVCCGYDFYADPIDAALD